MTIKIFVSYSHQDAAYLTDDSLLGFLRGLERAGVEFWWDQAIATGDKWDEEIRARINETDIALVLLSQAFLDSVYCMNVEISGFLEQSRAAGLVIFPIILSPCEWERHEWLKSRQFLPGGNETIEEHYSDPGRRKRLFLCIREDMRKQIDRIRQSRGRPSLERETGKGVALDLSHQQRQWRGFTAFVRNNPELHFHIIEEGIQEQKQEIESSSALVVALPWHYSFTDKEISYIEEWVSSGKGLFLLGFYLADTHHECNLNSLARMFGFEFSENLIMPIERTSLRDCLAQAFNEGDVDLSVTIQLPGSSDHPIVQGVTDVAFLSACSLGNFARKPEYVLKSQPSTVMRAVGYKDPEGWMIHIDDWLMDRQDAVPVLAAWRHGRGKVVASGTWKICTQVYEDNATLVKNILDWLSQPLGQ